MDLNDEDYPTIITEKISSPIESNNNISDHHDRELLEEEEPYMISKEQSNENINVEPINKPNPDSDGKVRFYLEEEEEDHQTEINSDPINENWTEKIEVKVCLLYTSPSPRDYAASRMPSSA